MAHLRWSLILVLTLVCAGGLVSPLLSGPATASIDTGVSAVDPEDYHERLNSGTFLWAGQAVYFNGSEVVENVADAPASERTFQIRRVNSGDRVGPLVREFVIDTDGERVIDTSGLQGNFVIRYQGNPVYVQNGTGYTENPPDATTVTVDSSEWEVAVQTLSAAWADDQVYRNQVVDLEITSNRAMYLLEVSAEGLDYDDLVSMFDTDDFADDHDAKVDDDVLILEARNDPDFAVRFADIENGQYTLEIEVSDSDASTTTMIQVGRTSAPTPTATPDLRVTPTAEITPTPTITEPVPTTESTTVSRVPSPVEPTTTEIPTTSTETPGQPGFGVVVALIAILLAWLVHRRRLWK